MRALVPLATLALLACGLTVRGDDATTFPAGDGGASPAADAGTLDATFAEIDGGRPAQADIRSVFDVDIVLNRRRGGWDPAQDSMDASAYVLVTASADAQLNGMPSRDVLPDDASFPENADHAAVQLGWRNDDDAFNARQLSVIAPDVTIPLAPFACRRLVLYGTSVEGTSTLAVTVHYADGTATTATTATFTDWASATRPADGFLLASRLHRASVQYPQSPVSDGRADFSLAGVRVPVDERKPLADVVIHDLQTSSARLYLLGIGLE